MLIRLAEIYENTEILSPIDMETWDQIAKTCGLAPQARVLELASGKGAFGLHLARRFACRVDGFDINPEFVDYAKQRTSEQSLTARVTFTCHDVNSLSVEQAAYDLGVSLGALYIFRGAGWRILMTGVKKDGYVAVSDLFCKKDPPPKELMEVFFEEEGEPHTLEDIRRWYIDRGMRIVREIECSRGAWLNYYDLTRMMLQLLAKKYKSDSEKQAEIQEAMIEDDLFRKYGEEYIGYMTFIMQKP